MSRTSKARMREVFQKKGFDFAKEFMEALRHVDNQTRLEALVSVAPFFMERLRPEPEVQPETPKDVTPLEITHTNDELTALLSNGTNKSTSNG